MESNISGGRKRHFLRKCLTYLATFDKVSCAPSTHSATGGGPDAMLNSSSTFSCGSNISGGSKTPFPQKGLIPLGDFWQGQLRPEHTFGNRGRSWCEAETLHQLLAVDRTFQGGSKTPFPQKGLIPLDDIWQGQLRPEHTFGNRGRSWCEAETLHQLLAVDRTFQGGSKTSFPQKGLTYLATFDKVSCAPSTHSATGGGPDAMLNSSSTCSHGVEHFRGGSKTPFPQKGLGRLATFDNVSCAPSTHSATGGGPDRSWNSSSTFSCGSNISAGFRKYNFPLKGLNLSKTCSVFRVY